MRYLKEGFTQWLDHLKTKWKIEIVWVVIGTIVSFMIIYWWLGVEETRIEAKITISVLCGTIGAEILRLICAIIRTPFRIIEEQYKTIANYKNIFSKEKIIKALVDYRTEGVKLRNRGISLMHVSSVDPWWEEFLVWQRKVKYSISILDKIRAEQWFILGSYTPTLSRPNLSPIHKKRLDMFDTWLNRLEKLIENL